MSSNIGISFCETVLLRECRLQFVVALICPVTDICQDLSMNLYCYSFFKLKRLLQFFLSCKFSTRLLLKNLRGLILLIVIWKILENSSLSWNHLSKMLMLLLGFQKSCDTIPFKLNITLCTKDT